MRGKLIWTSSTWSIGTRASMRPAQIAREIQGAQQGMDAGSVASMRPAQIAREIGVGFWGDGGRGSASMRPAQIAREIVSGADAAVRSAPASMRPAQIAREIHAAGCGALWSRRCFNEARANCAGNSFAPGTCGPGPGCFNEARANCAGNSLHVLHVRRENQRASMRPAQIAREI